MSRPDQNRPRLATPLDNLHAALGIIQNHILASDSVVNGKATFGRFYMPTAGLEVAAAMLAEALGSAEQTEWNDLV